MSSKWYTDDLKIETVSSSTVLDHEDRGDSERVVRVATLKLSTQKFPPYIKRYSSAALFVNFSYCSCDSTAY